MLSELVETSAGHEIYLRRPEHLKISTREPSAFETVLPGCCAWTPETHHPDTSSVPVFRVMHDFDVFSDAVPFTSKWVCASPAPAAAPLLRSCSNFALSTVGIR